VVADSPAAQAVLVEQRPLIRDVGGIGESLIDLEVIAPAGQFQPVVAPAFGQRRQLGERDIGELTREQRNRSCHNLIVLPDLT